MLLGLLKQGLQCRDCKVNVHKKCAVELPINCRLNDAGGIVGPAALPIDRMSVSDDSSSTVDQDLSASADQMIPLVRLPGQASVR